MQSNYQRCTEDEPPNKMSYTATRRPRNNLSLEERVQAIRAYDSCPMYTKVAKMFNCSWEQIKNIIANRDYILEYCESGRKYQSENCDREDSKRGKLQLLNKCLHEYECRMKFHRNTELNDQLLYEKALEFRDIIRIDNFVPNTAWLSNFQERVNSSANRSTILKRMPPTSLDAKDIVRYCSADPSQERLQKPSHQQQQQRKEKYQEEKVGLSVQGQSQVAEYEEQAAEETNRQVQAMALQEKRERKLRFLEKVVMEYKQRMQHHHRKQMNEENLKEIIMRFREILKIEHFVPNKAWWQKFAQCDNSRENNLPVPPLSVDPKDIISYCSRIEKNLKLKQQQAQQINANNKHPRGLPREAKEPIISLTNSIRYVRTSGNVIKNKNNGVKDEIVTIEDDDVEEIVRPPVLKIRKVETINRSLEQQQAQSCRQSPQLWHINDNIAPNQVQSYEDCLKLLKPIEEFALLEENYRAIGLLTQLEEILKNAPAKDEKAT